jgi:hypothetical protein
MSTKTKKKITPVMVAKDVLALVAAKKIIPTSCTLPAAKIYANLGDLKFKTTPKDLQEATKRAKFKCEACAKGAALVAFAHLADDVPLKDTYDDDDVSDALEPIFGQDQLDLMESAFELSYSDPKARDFGIMASGDYDYYSAKGTRKRLIAVMRNIVKNKGIFKP